LYSHRVALAVPGLPGLPGGSEDKVYQPFQLDFLNLLCLLPRNELNRQRTGAEMRTVKILRGRKSKLSRDPARQRLKQEQKFFVAL